MKISDECFPIIGDDIVCLLPTIPVFPIGNRKLATLMVTFHHQLVLIFCGFARWAYYPFCFSCSEFLYLNLLF